MTTTKGRKFLADLKLYSDYLGWRDEDGRYETFTEAATGVFDTHRTRYADKPDILPHFAFAEDMYKKGYFLASQRNLQFRGEEIFKHEFRMYNCLTMFADKPSWLGNAFYLLLCGCGVGVNMMLPFADRMPKIQKRTKGTKVFVIEDNIEGWSDAAHVLVSSYVTENPIFPEYQGYEVKFVYDNIRARGAKVGRRFKAPGPQGLKNAMEKIEAMMNTYLNKGLDGIPMVFATILMYDFFMHLADAVLSGGVRRSACSIICSPEDKELIYAKAGNWFEENPQRGRSNNSVGLIRGMFTKEEFQDLLRLNQGTSDIGFVFMNHIFEVLNPCFEIGFTPLMFDWSNQSIIDRIKASDITVLDEGLVRTAIQCCNLNEINGSKMRTKKEFLDTCRASAITGTAQAGYTKFRHLRGDNVLVDTIAISEREALLGVSITGLMNQPWLLDADVLREGAQVVIDTNKEIAEILGINASARSTTIKPGGNGPVVLQAASGVTPEHAPQYFRVMQLNKDTEVAKWMEENMSFMLEEGAYSENGTDWAVFVPIVNEEGTIYKSEMKGVKHLEIIKLIMDNWVTPGKVAERCIIDTTSHNVSNTVIIDNYEAMTDYIFANQASFTAVAFQGEGSDKDWNQAPNTSVLTAQELVDKYGDASMVASGLIVDGLHAFDNNLWVACQAVINRNTKLRGDRRTVFFMKDWIRRTKKFSKNFFKGDMDKTMYCLKDIHLFHKWLSITRQIKEVDFTQILTAPNYVDIDSIGAMACSGGVCEISRI